MKRHLRTTLAMFIVFAVVGAAGIGASSTVAQDEATPAAVSTGAAYLTVANSGSEVDRLVSASTDRAAVVELHEIDDVAGVMKMQPVEGGIEIPAGGSVALAPGGYHLMLIGLTESLLDGQSYELTLTFEVAGDVTVTVPVFASETAALAATPVAPVTLGALTITGIWSRFAPAMEQAANSGATAAGFMTIINRGSEADRLIAANASISASAEFHEMKEGDGGVMKMSPLPDGLEIPAGGAAVFESGGYHIMLIGITRDLTPGMTYELTLTFERAGDITIIVPVQASEEAVMTPAAAVTSGDITIEGQWTRMAPAMNGSSEMQDGTPSAGM